VSGSSPHVGEKGEELRGVLTEGTKGRHGGGIGRATVNGSGGRWWSVDTCFGARRGERVAGGAVGELAGGASAFYRTGGKGAEAVGE
jgi:hypothetical protein